MFCPLRVNHSGAAFPKLTNSDVWSTSMGAGGEDIKLSTAAGKLFRYSVECKSLKAFGVYKHLDQATENCPKGAEPFVILKGDRRQPLVLLDAEHFFKIVRSRKWKIRFLLIVWDWYLKFKKMVISAFWRHIIWTICRKNSVSIVKICS